MLVAPAMAATTQVQIVKYANDGTTILNQTTLTWQQMRDTLPVLGDGVTHYYHQGPVFVDNTNETLEQELRWNPAEDTNVDTKDMGAVKGTNLVDLCNLVGGMSPGEEVKLLAVDGWSDTYAYKNVYQYSSREGPLGITWYMNGLYPDTGYSDGMRMVWFADDSINTLGPGGTGIHAFGNYDWHEAAAEEYWYYYIQGGENYPTTTGLSGKYINRIWIYSDDPAPVAPVAVFSADPQSGNAPLTVQFTDASTGTPTSWAWDFENDGSVDSIEQSPSHIYDTTGTFTVNLTVRNAGGSDSEVKTDYIVVSEAPPLPVLNVNTGIRYATIQAAVTAATAGNTILVSDGSYTENVVIDKSIIIRSENGAATTTVTAATATVPVFDVNAADFVTIDGFTVRGATGSNIGGIDFTDSDSGTITNNDVANGYNGIHLGGTSTNNTISYNNCHDNSKRGLSMRNDAFANYAFRNTFSANTDKDICIKDMTHDNVVWLNNVLGGTLDIGTANTENSPTPITYTYGGSTYTSYLGNYYSVYAGVDADGNGVGDTAFISGSYWSDSYPLMAQSVNFVETTLPPAPVAVFSADPVSGNAPLTVQFTDQSTGDGIADWAWDFENDGTVDSTDQSPSHVYDTAGTYTVNLTVTNAGGSDSEVKTDYITVTAAGPKTWHVYEGQSIQAALDGASEGDTVFVHAGTYLLSFVGTGNLYVYKPSITLKGEGPDLVTLDGNGGAAIIKIGIANIPPLYPDGPAPGSIVEGFTIVNGSVGISVANSPNCIIRDNVIKKIATQAIVPLSSNTTITHNTIDMEGNNDYAVYTSTPLILTNNTISNVTGLYSAVYIYNPGASGSIITNNTITNNKCSAASSRAITIRNANNCVVADNTITNNYGDGIRLWDSANNNIITRNTISGNTRSGIFLNNAPSGNRIYLNSFINNAQAVVYGGTGAPINTWNSTIPIEYTYNSVTYTGFLGNYWGSNYTGVDASPLDGIGDTPFDIPGSATDKDYHPLMGTWNNGEITYTPPVVIAPVAAFISDVQTGTAPLTVNFTDQSTNTPTSWAWDVNNDGSVEYTTQNATHTYTTAGNYTVNLTVTNAGGSDSEVKTDYIIVTAAGPKTWYVHTSGELLQALTDASDGDTVFLYNGIYDQVNGYPFQVSVPNLTVTGESRDGVIIRVNGEILRVGQRGNTYDGYTSTPAPNCLIENITMTILTAGQSPKGIIVEANSPNCTIRNVVSDQLTYRPVSILAENCRILHSIFRNTTGPESASTYSAIYIYNKTNTVSGCIFEDNANRAADIYVRNAQNSVIENNIFQNNTDPGTISTVITARDSPDIRIRNNRFIDNIKLSTVYIIGTTTSNIEVNNCSFSGNNVIFSFNNAGNDNRFYLNNFINYTDIVTISGTAPATTYWTSSGPVDYTYNGISHSEVLGNYWDIYAGSDADSNGIGDTGFVVDASLGSDTAPLMGAWDNGVITYTPPAVIAPVAAFTSDIQTGTAPLTVNFTDQSSGSPTSYAWDFENDGTVDSTEQSPSHIYDTAGTYTVNLTVTNAGGSDAELKTDYIVVTAAPTIDEWSIAVSGKISQPLSRVDFETLADGNRLTYNDASGTWSGIALWRVLALVDDSDPASFSDSAADLGYNVTVTDPTGFSAVFPSAALKRNDGFILADTLNGSALPKTISDKNVWPLKVVGSGTTSGKQRVGNVSAITLADFVAPAVDVLYEGTVSVAAGSFVWTDAGGAAHTVSNLTPHGALQIVNTSAGIAYGGGWSSSKNTALIDWIEDYVYDSSVTPKLTWNYQKNSVFQNYFSTSTGISNNVIVDGDFLEFYFGPDQQTTENATAVVRITVDVEAAPEAPTAAFSAVTTSGTVPLTVQFTDASTGDGITSWAWDFENDGTVDSTDQSPSHIYDTAGTFTVNLTVMNAAGSDSEVKTDYITGTSGPSADILFDGDVNLAAGTFSFTAYNTGTAYQIDRLTPHGALDAAADAAGFTYNATDKKWATMGTMLLDDVAPYLYNNTVTPKLIWAYQVNGVKKNDFSSTEGISVYRVNDTDLVEFYYGEDGGAFENALAIIRARVHIRDQTVLFDDDLTLLPGTFSFTAYNSGSNYEINTTTPHGALDAASKAAGFTYNATDKKWATMGTMLLDDVGPFRYNNTVTPNLVWAYAVNGVTKNDYSSTEGISVYQIQNNDRVEFFYGSKGDTLENATAVVRIRVHISSTDDWTLSLKGATNATITKKYFEEAIGCIHNATYTDVSGTWGGVPLWALAGYVDDAIQHGPNAFNDTRAAEGYTVKVIATDGYNRTFNSADIARNDGYIVANTLNGQPLPVQYWPLKLVGEFEADNSVAKITSIELSIEPIPSSTEVPSVRIIKYGSDGTTEMTNITVNITTMENDYDVIGDGSTVYKFEGINFVPNDIWDANETYPGGFKIENAVKGTRIRDLADLAGGMGSGTEIRLVASDGWQTILPYSSIYTNSSVQARQGDAILAWWADGQYVPAYSDGIRVFFTPDDHIYGQWDMHETLASNYWHYYFQDGIQYPSAAGLSAKWITTIKIYSAPESDWSLDLDGSQIGGITYNVSKTYFEQALACQFGANHSQTYNDTQGNVWTGMPLWFLAGFVDDADQHSDNAFNNTLADSGYSVVLTARDGAQVVIDSRNIIRNNNYIVANTLNGVLIPETSSSWPLRLVGPSATGATSLKAIASIDLVPLEPQSSIKLAFVPEIVSPIIGNTKTMSLALSEVPTGLSGANVTISLQNTSIATITGITFPGWALVNQQSALPADTVTIKVLDLSKQVEDGATNVTLVTFTVSGDAVGSSQVLVNVNTMDDDDGTMIVPSVTPGLIRVLEPIQPINGVMPTDPDGDGLYDDLNGNGRLDFNDVVIFFNSMEWIAANEPVQYFDFNGNGRIDFDDIVEMFWRV
jgi:parallel beta-helix repeat protein